MSREGTLLLTLTDEKGESISEKVGIELRHERGASERKVLKDVDASQTIRVDHLRPAPDGLYQLAVNAPSFQPVRQIVSIKSDRPTEVEITLRARKGRRPPVNVSEEDAARMDELTQEVNTLILEMARIVGRNLGFPQEQSVVLFMLTSNVRGIRGTNLEFGTAGVDIPEPSDDEILVGCYDPVKKICCPGPCPC